MKKLFHNICTFSRNEAFIQGELVDFHSVLSSQVSFCKSEGWVKIYNLSKSKILLDPFKLTPRLMLGGLDFYLSLKKSSLWPSPYLHTRAKPLLTNSLSTYSTTLVTSLSTSWLTSTWASLSNTIISITTVKFPKFNEQMSGFLWADVWILIISFFGKVTQNCVGEMRKWLGKCSNLLGKRSILLGKRSNLLGK